MEDYKFITLLFQVPGGKELKYKSDDAETWGKITAGAQAASQNPETKLIFPSDFDSQELLIDHLISLNKTFSTYGTLRLYVKQGDDEHQNLELIRKALAEKGADIGTVSLVENTYTVQLLRFLPGIIDVYVTPRDERPDPADYLEGKAINPES